MGRWDNPEDDATSIAAGFVLRDKENGMRTLEEIRNTPVQLLTSEEIDQLDPKGQEWARAAQARRAKERACPGHERVGTSTITGWHPGRCKHCGMDMSYDSGD
jgi:hypothetical protein